RMGNNESRPAPGRFSCAITIPLRATAATNPVILAFSNMSKEIKLLSETGVAVFFPLARPF
ncbi:MAG: hypothetical protein ABGZ49_12490, partial [Akkermansiaceae bacterium]